MTCARRVRLDGMALEPDDFKVKPEGRTGGALNLVPGYTAYLALNALAGENPWLADGAGALCGGGRGAESVDRQPAP